MKPTFFCLNINERTKLSIYNLCGVYAAATYVMRKQIDKHEPSSSSYYEQKSTLFSTQSIDTNKSGSLLKQSLMNAAMRTSSLERSQKSIDLEEKRETGIGFETTSFVTLCPILDLENQLTIQM